MLSSITPVGENARRQRWWITASAYVVGSALGGTLVGGAVGAVGGLVLAPVPVAARLVAVALLALVGLAYDLGRMGHRLPSWRRQVDERWLTSYRGWVYGLGYGVQLGAGVATIVASALTYVVLALAAATATPAGGAAIGLVFGLTRALPLLALRRVTSPTSLTATHRRLARWAPTAGRVTASVEGAFVLAVPLLLVLGAT